MEKSFYLIIALLNFISMLLSIKLASMWNSDNCTDDISIVEYDEVGIDEVATEGIDGMKWGIVRYSDNDIYAHVASAIATFNGISIVMVIALSFL